MSVQLGNIVLDDNLQLLGIEEAEDLAVQELTSFDGTVDVLFAPAAASRHLSLVAKLDGSNVYGRFTMAQITAIKSMIPAAQPVTLTHQRGTFSVYVLAVTEFQLLKKYKSAPLESDWCVATINMIEV